MSSSLYFIRNSFLHLESITAGSMPDKSSRKDLTDDQNKQIIHITNESDREEQIIECGEICEFHADQPGEYDLFQVRKDGDDYYEIVDGLRLHKISKNTPKINRTLEFPIILDENNVGTEFYFCVMRSCQRADLIENSKCLKENGLLPKRFIIKESVTRVNLTDKPINQKFSLRINDVIEISIESKHGIKYHIDERKYCVKSAALYNSPDEQCKVTSSDVIYRKKFRDYGTIFLFRLTERNEIHDITVCIVNGKNSIRHLKIEKSNQSPDTIHIYQDDRIFFEWNINIRQLISKSIPIDIDDSSVKYIEVCH